MASPQQAWADRRWAARPAQQCINHAGNPAVL